MHCGYWRDDYDHASEVFAFLKCHAEQAGVCLPTFWQNVSVPSSCDKQSSPLHRNVRNLLSTCEMWNTWRAHNSNTPWRKPQTSQRPEICRWLGGRCRNPFNPLNAELNPICYLLGLLGARHFLHVSRIRVKSLTLRLLMSYIYIYILVA